MDDIYRSGILEAINSYNYKPQHFLGDKWLETPRMMPKQWVIRGFQLQMMIVQLGYTWIFP